MTVVILNPHAGSADAAGRVRAWAGGGGVEVLETEARGDARRWAALRAAAGDVVVAAGGDGTVHEVINGVADAERPGAVVGVLPLGTGNDLCRTLGIGDVEAALRAVDGGRVRPFDLLRVRLDGGDARCANVATGGFVGALAEGLDDDAKSFWGPLAYVRGALNVLPDLHPFEVELTWDGAVRRLEALNVVVANGRFAGAGLEVAPSADPGDGLLDILVVEPATKRALTGVAARLVAGDVRESEAVEAWRAKNVVVRSEPPMDFNLDGETYGEAAEVAFDVEPGALQVLVPEAPAV